METVGLVTSLRYDPALLLSRVNVTFAPLKHRPSQLYMLTLHRDRILQAAQAANRDHSELLGESGLNLMAEEIQTHVGQQTTSNEQAFKIRIVVYLKERLELTVTPVPSLPQTSFFPESLDHVLHNPPTYRIFVAPRRVSPSFHTRFKTTARSQYDELRSYLPHSSGDGLSLEILLVNQSGDVMEGSLTTPYFKQEDSWVTPAESSGGNVGTTRRWALESRLCKEGIVRGINVDTDLEGACVILSNGVRGFGWGRVEELAL